MGIRIRAGARLFGFVALTLALVATASPPLAAQEPSAARPPQVEKKTADPARRVPIHFGQIGLTPEQKEEIYKVRAKNQAKIEALQKEIAQLQDATRVECEALLTDAQKQLLALRREASARARKAKAALADTTASSKPDKPAN